MHRRVNTLPGILLAMTLAMSASAADNVKLIVLDPGHFHASLVQKDMYGGVDPTVSVYAPMGPEVLDYLNRVAAFNMRADHPTAWNIELHAGPDFFERMLREHPGNVVVLAGRNRPKLDRIEASVGAGLNVLADKPWIITSRDLPRLERVLNQAEQKHLVAYDIMTERYEITSILEKSLVNDPQVFGKLIEGTEAEPAITARSVHHLMKVVAGVPLRRPAWFFDINEQGGGLADVGTHVVDLVQWTVFPSAMIDYRKDIRILNSRRWPTVLSRADFERVTGEARFPSPLASHVNDGSLNYECNNALHYTVRGAHVAIDVRWNWESPTGDVYEASFQGSKARVELRQGAAQHFVPELYVIPRAGSAAEVSSALERWLQAMQASYPGVHLESKSGETHIVIPAPVRVGHEDHFGQVTSQYFAYLKAPASMPAWEKSNMMVKYFLTTSGN
ncbi:MAG TPA: putative oxidoreductase C-terminal domain-containing protein [Bryobacteraceae bacterium]|nr:putative oxidoreductase C-terminal domain-containing protein [Bryobacteraceae bacterium]